ncbi:hypothetical protein TIFTF001_017169 [Ficus carica]|uniref:Reverse transcriptase zinc-binding domain-containing protein n=1 Tax=Ficus carica TaxID=3494 RepID=A0AA88AQC0_FICCA|nr:hypothetical protein TIFTF001_017169 [Ficus carica]
MLPRDEHADLTVANLVTNSGWNIELDYVLWGIDKDAGLYSVKSGYKLEMMGRNEEGSSGRNSDWNWWKKLWHARIPNKVKIHLWRGFHEVLPARFQLRKRGLDVQTLCLRCHEELEDSNHARWRCGVAAQAWQASSIWGILRAFTGDPFWELCR